MSHTRTAALALLATALPACDGSATGNVGPRGGMVSSSDGALTLDVPAGAVDREVEVAIEPADMELPAGNVAPGYHLTPEGLGLRIPATLRVDAGFVAADERADLELVILRDGAWYLLPDQDTAAGDLSASVVFLSTITVVDVDHHHDDDHPGEDSGG
jgi:hypothetical protein